jgi:hypothetical protein
MSTENNFAYAREFNCFKNSAYVATFDNSAQYSEMELLGLLNSSVSEFIIKQTSPPLRGRPFRYRYKTQYVKEIPLPESGSDVESITDEIIDYSEAKNRVSAFPKTYFDSFDGDLGYINYEWQTRRYPVNADIQELADGRFAVTAGRSDEITDPLIDSGDREEQKLRAEYVHAAVDGHNMKSDEEQTIPIPQSREGVEQLMRALRSDQRRVEETDIDDLEADLDEVVYDLFDLSKNEREVIEEYLEIF